MYKRLLLLLPVVSFSQSSPAAEGGVSSPVTPPVCRELYLSRDIVYLFENTLEDFQQLSTMSASFLDVLIRHAQSDLLNPQLQSSYSTFAIVPFPSPTEICFGISCNFGQNFNNIPMFTESFTLSAKSMDIQPTAGGITEGMLFSQTLQHDTRRKETIILFVNNELGVEDARLTVQNFRYYFDVETIAVAVGGYYNLTALAGPGTTVHYLNATIDWYQLAQEIVTDMAKFGTVCIQ